MNECPVTSCAGARCLRRWLIMGVLLVVVAALANGLIAACLLWNNYHRLCAAIGEPSSFFQPGTTRIDVSEVPPDGGPAKPFGKLEAGVATNGFRLSVAFADYAAEIVSGDATRLLAAKSGAHFVAGRTDFPETRLALADARRAVEALPWWKRVVATVIAHPFVTGFPCVDDERCIRVSIQGGSALLGRDGALRKLQWHPPDAKQTWTVEIMRTDEPSVLPVTPAGGMEVPVVELDKSLAAVVRMLALQAQPVAYEADVRRQEGDGWLQIKDGRRLLHISGSAYEIGRQHGKLLSANVRRLVDRVVYGVGLIYSLEKGRWFITDARQLVERQRPYIPPEYFEELRGLADGSGVPLSELQTANIFPEFFHCSGVGLFGRATKGGTLLHARVLDYMTDVGLQDEAVVMAVHRTGARRWVNVSYAGFIGSVTGMNEQQVCIGEMGGRGEGNWDGTPMSFLVRGALENADTLDEAVEYMRARPRTCEYYYVVSDGKSRRAVGLATTPGKLELVYPGVAHPLLPEPVPDAVLMSAGNRYKELVKRVQARHGQIDAAALLDIVRRPVAMKSNLHNAVFEPEKLTLWVCHASRHAPACDQPVGEYRWAEMFPNASQANHGPSSSAFVDGLLCDEFIYETASFPSCHASTIVETKGGLVAAWFGGTKEGHPDVGIWLSRHEDDEWTTPVQVARDAQYPCWNPVLFQSKSGSLMLFYKVGPNPREWWGMLRTSADAGKTWSEARRMPGGIFGPIKNKPVQLANGDILCGTSTEHDGWRIHFERSADGGKTWTVTAPINDGKEIGAIQPSILFDGGDRLQAVGRTKQGKVFEVWSADNGRTWEKMTLTDLPNPNSGTDAVTLRDGRHLLVYNHTPKGRTPLNVAVSRDGKRWQPVLTIERDPGEYSYPAIIQTTDGLVHITYTWKRQRIKHVVIDPTLMKELRTP